MADLNKLAIKTEISVRDLSDVEVDEPLTEGSDIENEDRESQIFYDASDELDEFEETPEPIAMKLRDGRFIELPTFSPEQQKRRRRQRQGRTRGNRVETCQKSKGRDITSRQ